MKPGWLPVALTRLAAAFFIAASLLWVAQGMAWSALLHAGVALVFAALSRRMQADRAAQAKEPG